MRIPLTQGRFAIVDDCDYEWLIQWKWCYSDGYAKRVGSNHAGRKTILMFRVILDRMGYSPTRRLLIRGSLDYRRSVLRPELDLSPGPKKIQLTKGKFAIVDLEDYKYLMRRNWSYDGRYARRTARGTRKPVYMHRVILGRMGYADAEDTDHRDQDKLDNRRCQLRPATRGQNNANAPCKMSSSGYRGVHWYAQTKKWHAQIKSKGKRHHLGFFTDPVKAARAYDKAAKKFFGEFATLNGV